MKYWVRSLAIIFVAVAAFGFVARVINPWLPWGLLGAGIGGWVIVSRHRRRLRRQEYWARKQAVKDAEFLAALETRSKEQDRFCLGMRRRIARQAGVPDELVHPDDPLADYVRLGYVEPLLSSGCETIRNELGLEADFMFVAIRAAETDGPVLNSETLADYLRFHLENWEAIASRPLSKP